MNIPNVKLPFSNTKLTEICYPKTKTIITSDSSCNHKWSLEQQIGTEGTYGEIWSSCCNSHNDINCNHVLKYMPYNDGIRFNSESDILKEIELQNRCALAGLCPEVEDAWLCKTGGVIVMPIFEMTVRQLLLKYTDVIDKKDILANIITLVDKLHRYGIYHGDLHLDNIMVKSNKNGKSNVKYVDSDYIYSFIDLGKAGMFVTMNDPHIKEDYIDISAHIQDMIDEYPNQGFNDLYNMMKIYMKKFD